MLNGMEFQTVRAASLKAVRLTAVQNEKTANKRGIQTIIDRLETFTVNDLYPGRLPLALKLDIEIRLSDDVNQFFASFNRQRHLLQHISYRKICT